MAAIGRRILTEALSELLSQAAIALAVVTLVAAALGWFVAGRVLRPLRTMTATAGRLSAEHLSERVPQLAADEADRLLEPFVRGAGVRTHGDGGAGLGLSIVRAIVHAHHGEVTAVARDGGGLDVTVRLPAPEADSPRLPAQPSSAAANAATASKSLSCRPRCGSTRWSSARPP